MATQLKAPEPPDTHRRAALLYSSNLDQYAKELQAEHLFFEKKAKDATQPEEKEALQQLAKDMAADVAAVKDLQRQREEAEDAARRNADIKEQTEPQS